MMARGTAPELESVTVCAVLVVFSNWLPNASVAGGAGTIPATGAVPIVAVLDHNEFKFSVFGGFDHTGL